MKIERIHPLNGQSLGMMATGIASLTPREQQVLGHLLGGQQNKMIAYELGISHRTVEIHRGRVMKKMQARTLGQLFNIVLIAHRSPILTVL